MVNTKIRFQCYESQPCSRDVQYFEIFLPNFGRITAPKAMREKGNEKLSCSNFSHNDDAGDKIACSNQVKSMSRMCEFMLHEHFTLCKNSISHIACYSRVQIMVSNMPFQMTRDRHKWTQGRDERTYSLNLSLYRKIFYWLRY